MPQRDAPVLRLVKALPEKVSPAPPAVLAGQADSRLSIKVETLEGAAQELPPLFVRYHREVGDERIPIDPDWHAMMREEAYGRLLFVAARHEKVLAGFAISFLYFHCWHRGVPHAQTHEYLDPLYRVGMEGKRLLALNLDLLQKKGVKRAFIATANERLGKLYERVGYEFNEAAYAKVFP